MGIGRTQHCATSATPRRVASGITGKTASTCRWPRSRLRRSEMNRWLIVLVLLAGCSKYHAKLSTNGSYVRLHPLCVFDGHFSPYTEVRDGRVITMGDSFSAYKCPAVTEPFFVQDDDPNLPDAPA